MNLTTTWCVDTRQRRTPFLRRRKSRKECVYTRRQSEVRCISANRVGRPPADLSGTQSSALDRDVEGRHPSRLSPPTSLEEESSLGWLLGSRDPVGLKLLQRNAEWHAWWWQPEERSCLVEVLRACR